MLYVVGTVYFLVLHPDRIALAVQVKEDSVGYTKSIKNNRYLFSIAQSYILYL